MRVSTSVLECYAGIFRLSNPAARLPASDEAGETAKDGEKLQQAHLVGFFFVAGRVEAGC